MDVFYKKSFLVFYLMSVFGTIFLTSSAIILPINGQIISDDWEIEIEAYLQEVDSNTSAEIVVYIVQSLYGHGIKKDGNEINDIVELGIYIFNDMPLDTPNGKVIGIGKKGEDNGILILVAIEESEWRIEVGYGLEGYITDVESKNIADQYLIPLFSEGEYDLGIGYSIVAISLEIPIPEEVEDLPVRGRYLYESTDLPTEDELPTWVVVIIVIFVIFMILFGGLRPSGRIGRGSSRGPKGGGGRSGGGGSKGKW
jgi:uncharacterized protein